MQGWSKALKFLPDIIISDVMMPEKDGIAMTRELRADMTTSHIPIVLLTAKTSIESKLEGLEYGADDYITKPFSATYLKARVKNPQYFRLPVSGIYRDNLMTGAPATTSEEETVEEKGPEMSPNDRKFMDKLVDLMEKNMDNGELVVDDLVQDEESETRNGGMGNALFPGMDHYSVDIAFEYGIVRRTENRLCGCADLQRIYWGKDDRSVGESFALYSL